MKAEVLDTVELLEDLPEFNVRRGERGVVLDAYSRPVEAYDLEFVDATGESSRLAFSVEPHQLLNVDLKANEAYIRGMKMLHEGDLVEAMRAFRQAIDLKPAYIRSLHESFRTSCIPFENYEGFLAGLLIVKLLDPEYEIARQNLAITYLNWGVQEAKRGNIEAGLMLFQSALRTEAPEDVVQVIRANISGSHSILGIREQNAGHLEVAVKHFETALSFNPSDRTRRDLGLVYAHFADRLLESNNPNDAVLNYQYAEDTGLVLSTIYNNHAIALATTGKLKEAIILLESALQIAPDDEIVRRNLMNALSEDISKIIREVHELTFSSIPELQTAKIKDISGL